MANRPNALSALAPIILIVVAGFVYYAKYHWARTWVDERFPWVKENVGSRLPSLVVAVGPDGQPIESDETAAQGDPPPRQFVSSEGGVDLPKLAAEPAAWPKTVKLKKPREFPGVVDGKAVGKVLAPAGSETRLVRIQSGKLALEFRGGGTWVAPEETDLRERLLDARH
jgi:hypothetical protein